MRYQKRQVPEQESICAIVVTYHPDQGLPERIERISKQVGKVVIVDNNSNETSLAMIRNTALNFQIHLILNNKNVGVATALNQGVAYALDCGDSYTWFLTLDQDTIPFHDMVENLISAYDECPFKNQLGVIGSNYRELTTGEILYSGDAGGEAWAEVENLPTSGCLTSITAFKEVGRFRDDLFIDYVDIEYCMRLREKGFRVIIMLPVFSTSPPTLLK